MIRARVRGIVPALVLAAAVALASEASAGEGALVVRARTAHLGDGRVVADAVVICADDRITWVGPSAGAPVPAGARELACDTLLPGLVAERRPEEPADAATADVQRLAVDLLGALDEPALLARGVTSVVVSPGTTRLVPGRGGLVTLRAGGGRVTTLKEGAVHLVLTDDALRPPPLFEPVLRVNADNPLPPARLQRPATPMAALAEARRLLAAPEPAWIDVRARRVPLRVRARSEAEIRRALGLAHGRGLDLVIEGADEAWRLAPELASEGASVVLEAADPLDALGRRLEPRPDAAALLAAAGVDVALAAPGAAAPDPLALAAAAVRGGLSPADAIAAVTGRLAAAAGARNVGILAAGARADLLGVAGDPLASSAHPDLLVLGGEIVAVGPAEGENDDEDGPPLALRVGRALTPGGVVEPAIILVRAQKIAAVAAGGPVPAEARVLDLGPGSVAVAGFIDAFSRVGLDPGPPPGGNARTRAVDALEPAHATLERALEAGVTSALAVPATRGHVLGMAGFIGTGPRRAEAPHDADEPRGMRPEGRPVIDVIAADAGLVFWLDDGPSDSGQRQPRLRALRELLQKAKGYHDAWEKEEKKRDEKPGEKSREKKKAAKPADPPEKDPQLEPYRAMFAGRAKAWLRSGREDLLIAGLDAFKGVGVTPVLCGAEEADRVASDLASRGVGVILGPRPLRMDPSGPINVAAVLRAEGVPVAFGSFGHAAAESLPLAVAGLVREGLAAPDALAGLTSTAASLSGQERGLGRLEAGARADILVFSGDPMEPSSRLLRVVARGREVAAGSSNVAEAR